MFTGRNADEPENLSNTHIRALSFPGQHAIDAWESEGGGPAGAGRGRAPFADRAQIVECVVKFLYC